MQHLGAQPLPHTHAAEEQGVRNSERTCFRTLVSRLPVEAPVMRREHYAVLASSRLYAYCYREAFWQAEVDDMKDSRVVVLIALSYVMWWRGRIYITLLNCSHHEFNEFGDM